MSPTDDAKLTQKLECPFPRKGPARSPFAGGRMELMSNPAYQFFREMVSKDPQRAAAMIADSPECAEFAARMLSDPETGLCIDTGVTLLCAAERDVAITPAIPALKAALLYDSNDQLRVLAAKAFYTLAIKGHDISDALVALDSAHAEDSSEAVQLTAEMALIAADREPGHPRK